MDSTKVLDKRTFELLPKGEQMSYLWDHCKYITVRVENNFRINLYGCLNFYAEVWYKYGINKVYKIIAFQSVDRLEPYLDMIDISDCLETN